MDEDVQAITVPVVASWRMTRLPFPEMFPPGAACQEPLRKCPAALAGAVGALRGAPRVAATTGTVASVVVWPGLSVQARRVVPGMVAAAPLAVCGVSSTARPAAVKVAFPAACSVTGWTAPVT